MDEKDGTHFATHHSITKSKNIPAATRMRPGVVFERRLLSVTRLQLRQHHIPKAWKVVFRPGQQELREEYAGIRRLSLTLLRWTQFCRSRSTPNASILDRSKSRKKGSLSSPHRTHPTFASTSSGYTSQHHPPHSSSPNPFSNLPNSSNPNFLYILSPGSLASSPPTTPSSSAINIFPIRLPCHSVLSTTLCAWHPSPRPSTVPQSPSQAPRRASTSTFLSLPTSYPAAVIPTTQKPHPGTLKSGASRRAIWRCA